MAQLPDPSTPPGWTEPGNRWGPWLYWPMLCIGVGLLVWRVSAGASTGQIALAAAHVLLWICLLTANRSTHRRRSTP